MTKKFVLILVGFVLAFGVLGAAGYAYAQVGDSPETETTVGADEGLHHRIPGSSNDHWFGFRRDEGILGGYIFDEMAEILGLSDEAIAAFEKVKETMNEIRDQYTPEEIREMMKEALTEAVEAALDDGSITQEQADRILDRLEQQGLRGFDRFSRPGDRGRLPRQDIKRRVEGLMGQYMEAAFADALGLTVEEFQTLKTEEGFNVTDYAVEQDMTVEELQDWMGEIYASAINLALEDGAITQDQADKMFELLEDFDGRNPFGPKPPVRRPGR